MGVQGLWELLAPVGRRVSVETLAGKKLAIDASIWIIQFMKAMRDEKGEMVRNAHLIGFFRRICKLLFLRTKPVFVFDGGTPALKRRTVIARRRQRENAQAKIRKTAEKLLLNQVLKGMRLKELAKDLENQRRQQKSDAKGKNRVSDESVQSDMGTSAGRSGAGTSGYEQEKLDEMLAASMEAEKDGILTRDADEIENLVMKSDAKGKRILLDGGNKINMVQSNYRRSNMESMKDYQEKLDEMLAASIAAEDDGNLINNSSTPGAAIPSEGEDTDEDEQMLLPAMHGNVDPAVLGSLPPSMQLDLLVQMRERLMAENRQKYQKVKKAPEKFSELQIQAYLKTVAFRHEIDEVQKAASGRGVGGVQTSRIASEANREFIFSSSFTGDKQVLTSARVEGNGEKQQNTSTYSIPNPVKSAAPMSKSDAAVELDLDEPRNPNDGIEIYKDERGRFRIRNRHMGIRMTRDIQRNLDLMKEKERKTVESMFNKEAMGTWDNFSSGDHFVETSPCEKGEYMDLNDGNEQSMLKNGTSIEISFEDEDENKSFDDDGIFAQLAAGVPLTIDNPKKQSSSSASDSDSEEMPVERKSYGPDIDGNSNIMPIPQERNNNDESEVEWEEGPLTDIRNSAEESTGQRVLQGYIEEEADLQEAIRRSLLDVDDKKSESISSEIEVLKKSGDILFEENSVDGVNLVSENATQQSHSFSETVDGVEEKECLGTITVSETIGSLDEQVNTGGVHNTYDQSAGISKLSDEYISSDESRLSMFSKRFARENFHSLNGVSDKLHDASVVDEKRSDSLAGPSILVMDKKNNVEVEKLIIVDDRGDSFQPEAENLITDMKDPSNPVLESSTKKSSYDVDLDQNLAAESRQEKNFAVIDDEIVAVEFTDADLEEQMLNLDQEFMSLGDEQRRLERNAESVSGEMFAECQELLQIFGLPYIIAPMEAEAQCAYMELSNLVDGVVTDDSDVFLFGARSVYKNIFDERKYVETYFMKDIEKELGLTREKLIRMALLLGSDYTEGVSGIGIVNAIEVVNAFPEEDGLQEFREWVESPDPTILGKADVQTGSSVKNRGSKAGDNMKSSSGVTADDMQEIKQIFMDNHRNVSKNWHIPLTFPSEAVTSAYSSPQVDWSTEPFSWGKPDLFVIRKLCWEKFGWNSQKTDDLLLPVLKEYEKRETQLRMEAFYSFNERFAKIRSKRIKKAVKGITGSQSSELTDDTLQEASRSRKKRRVKPLESGDYQPDKDSTKAKQGEENRKISLEKIATRASRKSSLEGNKRCRGKGRAQRGGRGQKGLGSELSESSSDDTISGNDGHGLHDADSEQPLKLRRSTRSRNPVNYNVNDSEDDVAEKSACNKEITDENSEGYLFEAEGKHGGASVDPSVKKQNEVADTLFKDDLSEDSLHVGGGFCANEGETGEPPISHDNDPHSENKSPDNYFIMGGGFCMDESETAEDQGAAENSTLLMENENFMDKADNDTVHGKSTSGLRRGLDGLQNLQERDAFDAELNLDLQTLESKAEYSAEDTPSKQNAKIDIGTPPSGTLSAMPALKRKRRKS